MGRRSTVWLGVLVLVAHGVRAEEPNPYLAVVERNIFGLKAAPVPAQEVTPVESPPVSGAKVVLTGITSIFGPSSSRALLEIVEQEPGKQGGTRRPVLREGERDGSVEIVSIDVEKSIVKIRNAGTETELTFPKQVSSSIAANAPPPGGTVYNLAGTPTSNPTAPPTPPPPAGTIAGNDARGYSNPQGTIVVGGPPPPVSTFGRRPGRPSIPVVQVYNAAQ